MTHSRFPGPRFLFYIGFYMKLDRLGSVGVDAFCSSLPECVTIAGLEENRVSLEVEPGAAVLCC